MNIQLASALLARKLHSTQVRKYKGNPYFDHLAEVGMFCSALGMRPELVSIGLLHDAIEDQDQTPETLYSQLMEMHDFDHTSVMEVIVGVAMLSENKNLKPRKVRKAQYAEQLKFASREIQAIKVVDIYSNANSCRLNDPNFWKVWSSESLVIMNCFTNPLYPDFYKLTMEELKK